MMRQLRERNPPNYYQPPGNPNSDNHKEDNDHCNDDGSKGISANNGGLHSQPKFKLASFKAKNNSDRYPRKHNKDNFVDSFELDLESSDDVEATGTYDISFACSRDNNTWNQSGK